MGCSAAPAVSTRPASTTCTPTRTPATAACCYTTANLTDGTSLMQVLQQIVPDEVYHLAAQSHVRVSFDLPIYSVEADAVGTLHLLEAVRAVGHGIRFYQASSSEMFGKVAETPQTEATPFHPRSPYACAKVFSYWQTINYREAYDLFACNGILFNHESPRRGETFVTRKITRAATRIKVGLQERLYLGNLEARRDWGFAGDYVEAMWLILQQDAAGRFRDRHRRGPFGAGIRRGRVFARRPGLAEVCRDRPALLPAQRSRSAVGRRHQGSRKGWAGSRR